MLWPRVHKQSQSADLDRLSADISLLLVDSSKSCLRLCQSSMGHDQTKELQFLAGNTVVLSTKIRTSPTSARDGQSCSSTDQLYKETALHLSSQRSTIPSENLYYMPKWSQAGEGSFLDADEEPLGPDPGISEIIICMVTMPSALQKTKRTPGHVSTDSFFNITQQHIPSALWHPR